MRSRNFDLQEIDSEVLIELKRSMTVAAVLEAAHDVGLHPSLLEDVRVAVEAAGCTLAEVSGALVINADEGKVYRLTKINRHGVPMLDADVFDGNLELPAGSKVFCADVS